MVLKPPSWRDATQAPFRTRFSIFSATAWRRASPPFLPGISWPTYSSGERQLTQRVVHLGIPSEYRAHMRRRDFFGDLTGATPALILASLHRTSNHHLQKRHLFASRADKRERRKGSSRRQQTAYGAAVDEVARELLLSARCRKEKMAAEGTSSTTGRWLLQSVLVSAVDSCHCPRPPHPSTALLPIASLSDQVWCIQRCDCVNCT